MNYEALGKRIRAQRKLREMTQEALAEAVGISCSFLGHIERGSRKLSVDTLVSIADVLHVSCDLLLQDSMDQTISHRSGSLSSKKKLILREIIGLLDEE